MKDKVYAQVYSMVRVSEEGLLNALRYFSEVGYDGVELVGSNTEGLSVVDFKSLLEELHLKVAAVHSIGGKGDMEFAKELGADYIAIDIHMKNRTREEVLRVCEELNETGKMYRENGLKAIAHNHSDEFLWVAGEEGKTRVYDLLLAHTDPALMGYELDVGWAALTGADVISYIKENPGRFPLIHVKECNRVAKTEDETAHFPKRIFGENMQRDPETNAPILTEKMIAELYESRNWNQALGEGIIDWRALVEAADAQGCLAYINEREYYHINGSDGTAAACARLDHEFLREL